MNNLMSQLASKVITGVWNMAFLPSAVRSGFRGSAVKVPSDFTPVLRFAACSDIHLNGEEDQESAKRFRQLFDDMYAYAENSSVYKKFDAMMVAGDFSGGGAEKQYQMYKKITDEKIRPETRLLTVIGNHEFIDYRDVDATVGYTVYKKYVSEEMDTDIVVNGYHFIGIAYDDNGREFRSKVGWLDETLKKVTAENPEKPVFCLLKTDKKLPE